jgi:hypothetical protein
MGLRCAGQREWDVTLCYWCLDTWIGLGCQVAVALGHGELWMLYYWCWAMGWIEYWAYEGPGMPGDHDDHSASESCVDWGA